MPFPLVTAVREGRLELPRPLGHRILRLLAPRMDPGSTCRPVSAAVVLYSGERFRSRHYGLRAMSCTDVVSLTQGSRPCFPEMWRAIPRGAREGRSGATFVRIDRVSDRRRGRADKRR